MVRKKESASFQSSTDVGRHRVAFVAGDGRVAGQRDVATADAVRVECCSVSAEFEWTEWGGERIFIGGGVVTVVAGAERGRTSRQVALTPVVCIQTLETSTALLPLGASSWHDGRWCYSTG